MFSLSLLLSLLAPQFKNMTNNEYIQVDAYTKDWFGFYWQRAKAKTVHSMIIIDLGSHSCPLVTRCHLTTIQRIASGVEKEVTVVWCPVVRWWTVQGVSLLGEDESWERKSEILFLLLLLLRCWFLRHHLQQLSPLLLYLIEASSVADINLTVFALIPYGTVDYHHILFTRSKVQRWLISATELASIK